MTAFIICEQRRDTNHVKIPVACLERWQASCEAVADFVANILDLIRPGCLPEIRNRWDLGVFRGLKGSSHLVLSVEKNCLTLTLAGHKFPLVDVLHRTKSNLSIDRQILAKKVDQPLEGGGDGESAAQRKKWLQKRVDEEKAKGNKAFLKTVASESKIAVSTLKDILGRK